MLYSLLLQGIKMKYLKYDNKKIKEPEEYIATKFIH